MTIVRRVLPKYQGLTALPMALALIILLVPFDQTQAAIDPKSTLETPAPVVSPFGKSTMLTPPNAPPAKPVSAAPTSTGVVDTGTGVRDLAVFHCGDLRRSALRMSAHASNIANRTATRTPEGGPYKRIDVVCRVAGGAFCDVQKSEEVKQVYSPTSPDADSNGYVKFPDISLASEWAGLNAAAAELKLLAQKGVCGTKAIDQGTAMLIKYHSDFEVMTDTFQFHADGRVSTWSRVGKDGKASNLAFRDDGTIVGQESASAQAPSPSAIR